MKDLSKILAASRDASSEGVKIIKKSLKSPIESKKKSYKEWVTETDLKVEKKIMKVLLKHFPKSSFLAEESGSINNGDDSIMWIIDPIDGTNNFITRYPFFCISIAAYYKGKIICGTIEDPNNGEFFHAIKGKGSYLNNKRIFVSNEKKLENSIFGTGFVMSEPKSVKKNLKNLLAIMDKTKSFRRSGSAALDLAYTACGRQQGYWQLLPKPWDYAAGILLVEEANGKVTDMGGKKMNLDSKSILASNKINHNKMLKLISP